MEVEMVRACYEKRGGKEVQRKSKAEERMDSESRSQRERTIEGGTKMKRKEGSTDAY